MVSSFSKFEDRFPFLKFGHFFCPFLKSRKKSLKKKIYKTINQKTGLKTAKLINISVLKLEVNVLYLSNKFVTTYYVIFNKN